MADEWVGLVTAVAPKYLKGAADETVRKRLVLAMLDSRGLINLNYLGSHETFYDIDYKEPPVESYGDGAAAEYARRDYLKRASMDWRGYLSTDLMTVKEKLESRGGDTAMVNRYKRIFPKLTKGVKNQLGLEFYKDGLASGNENRFCGIETFMGVGTVVAADKIHEPSDTYNGISTAVNQSGRWTSDLTTSPNANIATDWPEGEGSTDYDYYSPKLINTSSTSWGTDQTTFEDNCERAIRAGNQWLTHTSDSSGDTVLVMLNGAWMTDFQNKMTSRNLNLMPHPMGRDLGFPNVMNYDGMAIYSEFGIPAQTGYMMDMSRVELDILDSKLISSKGPDYDPNSLAWKFAVYTFGNWKFFPKHFAKLYPWA